MRCVLGGQGDLLGFQVFRPALAINGALAELCKVGTGDCGNRISEPFYVRLGGIGCLVIKD